MLAAARDLKRRSRELERAQAKLQKERDAAIRKAVKGGMPLADVGEAFDISQQRVSQIVQAGRRTS
jgi:DNA-directed RNA polymerase specialized sigma24 family protein